jgi:hypothetical protein
VFEDKLETALEHDIGTDFDCGWFNTNAERFGFRGKNEAAKNPHVMTHLLREALASSRRPETLIQMVQAALRLI